MSLKTIGEIVGFIGVAEGILIFISNKREKILFYKLISDVLWTTSYFLQGATTGGINCSVGIAREFVFLNREKHKWADTPLWLVLFLAVSLISPTVECVKAGQLVGKALLPAAGTSLAILGYFNKNSLVIKWISIVANGLYLIYGFTINSISVILCDSIFIVSAIIGLIHEKDKLKDKPDSEDSH